MSKIVIKIAEILKWIRLSKAFLGNVIKILSKQLISFELFVEFNSKI